MFPPPQIFDLKFTLQLPAFHVDADRQTRSAMTALQSLYWIFPQPYRLYRLESPPPYSVNLKVSPSTHGPCRIMEDLHHRRGWPSITQGGEGRTQKNPTLGDQVQRLTSYFQTSDLWVCETMRCLLLNVLCVTLCDSPCE